MRVGWSSWTAPLSNSNSRGGGGRFCYYFVVASKFVMFRTVYMRAADKSLRTFYKRDVRQKIHHAGGWGEEKM